MTSPSRDATSSAGPLRSSGSGPRHQLLQLFTCQRCRKKRRQRRPTGEMRPDLDSSDTSHNHETTQLGDIARKTSPRGVPLAGEGTIFSTRTSKTKPLRPQHLQVSSGAGGTPSITSILKNRNSPSPVRDKSIIDALDVTDPDASRTRTRSKLRASIPSSPIRVPVIGLPLQRGEPSNSILARCAKLKNESGYGSFSFQRNELLRFTSGAEEENDPMSPDLVINPNRLSAASESSSSSGSPCPAAPEKSGKRARFNEAVDVIVDDRRSGKPMVKDSVKLKTSADVLASFSGAGRRLDERYRKRIQSDCDAVYSAAAAAARSHRHRRVFGEARMTIEHAPDPCSPSHGGETGGVVPTLRIVIRLAEEFARDRVFVRTARGGTRLLVGAYRPEPLGDGTNYLRQLVDRYSLPHAVDVMSVTATLGALAAPDDLVITAQLVDYDIESDY